MKYQKRSSEEQIVMSISAAAALCILPFLIIRIYNQDWHIALLDFVAVATTTSLLAYVYFTKRTLLARWVLSIICIGIATGTIWLKGPEQIVWVYPAIICLFFIIPPNLAALLCVITVAVIGYLLSSDMSMLDNVRFYFSTLITFIFSYAFSDRMLYQQAQLLILSYKDPLTGAGNRRAMEEKLIEFVAQQRQQPADNSACLLLIDLDEFKKINDRQGHACGDDVLAQTAALIEHILNPNQHLFRFGGEEFVVLASNTLEQTIALAENIRQTVNDFPFEQGIRITVSIGLAEYQSDETGFEWLGRADTAMYQAKSAGRDLCCLAAS
ncbi:MAG: GGDEF domain-containing protein [Paraglaciecola polaris]|uniref:GGDEF domain-containing protein n=1 Tax=Paraglaciecola polaris TaxID=222814 RepID=UPI003001B5C2|tara:strand:- start:17264 stop:18241 length:978 start_codon:yes stop_codon:yes gene_type:complete